MKTKILLLISLFSAFSLYQKQTRGNAEYDFITKKTATQKDSTLQKSMERGAQIYTDFCIQCHQADGTGVAGTFPPLAKADFLLENVDKSIHAVKFGLNGEITVNEKIYANAMPSPGLYDGEIADVMNYILNSWENTHEEIITQARVEAIEE